MEGENKEDKEDKEDIKLFNSVKLKAKLKKKRSQRTGNGDSSSNNFSEPDFDLNSLLNGGNDTDIFKMMNHVNKILKTNPELVKQVSKCVTNVMNDKTLIDTITGKIQDQTLDNSEETEEPQASTNELRQ